MKTVILMFATLFAVVFIGGNLLANHLNENARVTSAEKYAQEEAKRDIQNKDNCAAGRGSVMYYKGVYCTK